MISVFKIKFTLVLDDGKGNVIVKIGQIDIHN